MSKVKLTRYLYNFYDVKISLLVSLLEKKNLNKCYYWLSELYYSGFENESWEFIMKIYYDFYSLQNYKFEKIIIKKYKIWLNDKKINYSLEIIKNLYYKNYDNKIFILSNFSINTIKKNKKQNIDFTNYKINCNFDKLFVNSLYQNNVQYAIYIIKNNKCDKNNILMNLNVFTKKKFSKNIYYKNINKQIIVYLIRSLNKLSFKTNKNIKITEKELNYIEKINLSIKPVYKTLKYNRLFQISIYCNCFNEIKNKLSNEQILWYHWEYFSKDTPLWKDRFKKYNASFCDKTKKVIFKNVDDDETFHEKYDYEPDEQSYDCQNKSILNYDKLTISDFMEDLFVKSNNKQLNTKLNY